MTMFKCESCGHEQLPARQEQGDDLGDLFDPGSGSKSLRRAESIISRQGDDVRRLREALELAISEYEKLPHSLGYEFTHLPAMRAALSASAEGK